MSNQLILVLPNFDERPDSLDIDERNVALLTTDEGLTPTLAAILSIETHDYILSELKCYSADDSVDPTALFTEYALRNDLADFDDYDLTELALELSASETPKLRGNRTVLIDVEASTIYVGTAVVYNPRRAAVGVVDAAVAEYILDF